jgi:hypothetical protein
VEYRYRDSPHYAGPSAGNHPEDTPDTTQGRPRRTLQPREYNDEEDDDALYTQRPPTSARRYLPPREEVYTRGNRQIVVHREPPPKKRDVHWMLLAGTVMCIMVLGWMALSALGGWWQTKQDDWKYGNPRTFQIDQFVGHADSPDHPNHFIAINLKGIIEVVEINTQMPKDDHIYAITTASDSFTPVSIAFADTNHDGKVDMLVTIGDSNPYTVVLLNTGK